MIDFQTLMAIKLAEEIVELPGLGQAKVRELTSDEAQEVFKLYAEEKVSEASKAAIFAGMLNEDSTPVFTNKKKAYEAIGKLRLEHVNTLSSAIMNLTTGSDTEDEVKN